ncbi:winged helix-turn-helix transcriptional regulator [uncultured Jatrophihabitans sp.]|uniref:winged helix-turn-helix transcriptional regulator n=1 Tax=uncultured Jatrophihabitans sp. TaxID=1610747 RepID=UPI0035CAA3F3
MTDDTAILEGALANRSAWRADRCPVGKALEVIGTRSAMLIMREAFYGTTRFDDFAERVGVTETVAAARLRELTAAGLLRREPYQDPGQRTRHEYRLTDMGRDLLPAVLGLFEWGSKYLSPGGRGPLRLGHAECGAEAHVAVRCEQGHDIPLNELSLASARRR